MTGRSALGTLVAAAAGDSDMHERERLLAQYHRERARRALVLDSIRVHLDEQPSPRTIRACARLWCRDITTMAEAVVTARQNQEHDQ